MRHRWKIVFWSGILLFSLLILFSGFFTPGTPPSPPAWANIHVGMHRSEIIRVLGLPQLSGYPEKIVETYVLEGALGVRKLEVLYQEHGNDKATMVRENIYWRPKRGYIAVRGESVKR